MATLLETLQSAENVLLDEFYTTAEASEDGRLRTVIAEEVINGISYVNLGQESTVKGKFDHITIAREQFLRVAAKLRAH